MNPGQLSLELRNWLLVIMMSLLVLALDFITGPQIRFPIGFVIPVTYAAWYLGKRSGIALAVLLPVIRLFVEPDASVDYFSTIAFTNAGIRILVLSFIAWQAARVAEQSARIELQNKALKKRLKVLEGLLSICCFCKKIKRKDGTWEQLETYISHHSEVKFSHGFCEECALEHYPEVFTDETDNK